MSSSSNEKGETVERKRDARRHRRSVEEKRQIAEASLQPGASVPEGVEKSTSERQFGPGLRKMARRTEACLT